MAGAIGNDGSTLLHEAARDGDMTLARRLITRGIAINALITTTVHSLVPYHTICMHRVVHAIIHSLFGCDVYNRVIVHYMKL